MNSKRKRVDIVEEAQSMLDQARLYQETMALLPDGDSRKEVYNIAILDLLARSRRLCGS